MAQLTHPSVPHDIAPVAPTPPLVSGGLPIVGHALQFNRDRRELLTRGLWEHGRVFQVRLGPQKVAVVVGPEQHKIVYTETDKRLNMQKPYYWLKAMFGKALFLAPHDEYLQQRPAVLSLFKRQKMVTYLQLMQEVVQKWIDTLPEEGEFEITELMMWLAQEVAGTCFLGDAMHAEIGREFWDLYHHLTLALDPVTPPHWPLPKFIRRDRAKKRMQEILVPIIEERRTHAARYDDQLQELINAMITSEYTFTNQEIIDLLIGLMFAGHETTAGQAAWNMILLLQHPDSLAAVQAEVDTLTTRGALFDHRAMAEMKHLAWSVQETERLYPSADINMRYADEPLEIGGYHIPAGWLVQTAAEVAHRLPELWDEPERYDPLRFSPGREENRQSRFALIGFGGGLHKCPGMNFANNEMMIITALMLQQLDLTLLTPNPTIRRGLGANRPSETRVRFKRKA